MQRLKGLMNLFYNLQIQALNNFMKIWNFILSQAN